MKTRLSLSPILPQKAGHIIKQAGFVGSSIGLAMAQAADQHPGVTVVITPDNRSAQQLASELLFFYPQDDLTLLNFPDWETLPYDIFSPHQDLVSERIHTLARLSSLSKGVLIVPIKTLLQRLAPKEFIGAHHLDVKVGDRIDLIRFKRELAKCAYRSVNEVVEHSEYAVRGSIIDLFPMGSPHPYRIDLFDDEIESIRIFDPETQRTAHNVDHISLLPAHEFPLTEESIATFRQNFRARFTGNPLSCPLYQDVSQGLCPSGIEYYLPLFFDHTLTLFDYLPEDCLLLSMNGLMEAATSFWQEIKERYEQRAHDITRPILKPDELYITVDACMGRLRDFPQLKLLQERDHDQALNVNIRELPNVLIEHRSSHPLSALDQFLKTHSGRILFVAESRGRREALLDLLKTIHIQPESYEQWATFLDADVKTGIIVAPLDRGLWLNDPNLIVLTESQLFGEHTVSQERRKRQHTDVEMLIRNLAELSIGDPVVHIDHGVGRYLGLQTLKIQDYPEEFLQLEYAGGDKLYVPVSSLDLISRYSGSDPEHAPLHRLGTDQWQKAKRKAAEQAEDVAAELLDLYAQRAARKGHAFPLPDEQYFIFSAGFPYEETPDQQSAIAAVIKDLVSEQPMDRLICGDVGFGKTEVALRAAFLTVQGGKQVAILVPTTLLAQQHYESFCDRFADWPVSVELLSRFRTKKEQTDVIARLKSGKVDILIGTHALLQSQICFNDLGLLIIDEEHRFGVNQKERLKSLRAEVDILTLTATPIPRTLNMAMSGLRELSIIATPPARRLSIKTFVHEHQPALIREAVLREILRGGQVYYLHNRVETIEKTAEKLREWVPEARIRVGHGQLHERELESVMSDFYHQRFNVLVCTTIIETGIDVPTANTIIMDRADLFGFAQLHQLRGRVGRSHHQAYAYLLTPDPKTLTKDAEKRLDAFSALEDLGIGFTLATHDMEIRGAGELLGENQSGHVHAIGFSLYMELLERAIAMIKSGVTPALQQPLRRGVEIDLKVCALIREDYMPDVHHRLVFYKQLASAVDLKKMRDLQVEMIDRFGLLPDVTKHLFRIAELKLHAKPLGIKKIEAGPQGGSIEFDEKPNINFDKLMSWIQQSPQKYKFNGKNRLAFTLPSETFEKRVELVEGLLGELHF